MQASRSLLYYGEACPISLFSDLGREFMTVKILKTHVCYEDIVRFLPFVSEERRRNIQSSLNEEYRITSLMTELFIRAELADTVGLLPHELRLGRREHGKPFLSGREDVHFSVSHSDGWIAFVRDDAPVGLDIQRISHRERKPAMNFFTASERELILSSDDPDGCFFRAWTAKEAYIKLLGTGLSTPLRSVDTVALRGKYGFASAVTEGFAVTVCSTKADVDMQLVDVSQEALLGRWGEAISV